MSESMRVTLLTFLESTKRFLMRFLIYTMVTVALSVYMVYAIITVSLFIGLSLMTLITRLILTGFSFGVIRMERGPSLKIVLPALAIFKKTRM